MTGNHSAHSVSHVPSFTHLPPSQQPQQQPATQQPPTAHVQQQSQHQQQLAVLSQHATQQQAKLQANNIGQQPQAHQNQPQQRSLHSSPTNQNQVWFPTCIVYSHHYQHHDHYY